MIELYGARKASSPFNSGARTPRTFARLEANAKREVPEAPPRSKSELRELSEIISLPTLLAYALPRFAHFVGTGAENLATLVYIEVRGMNLSTIASL